MPAFVPAFRQNARPVPRPTDFRAAMRQDAVFPSGGPAKNLDIAATQDSNNNGAVEGGFRYAAD
jgi:hypothetical protein